MQEMFDKHHHQSRLEQNIIHHAMSNNIIPSSLYTRTPSVAPEEYPGHLNDDCDDNTIIRAETVSVSGAPDVTASTPRPDPPLTG